MVEGRNAAGALSAPPLLFHGPGGETGRREGLKIPFPQGIVGSNPAPGICMHRKAL
jgi:hypothetical protein